MVDEFFEPNALAHAKRCRDRYHREVELLVVLAADPMLARAAIRDLKITVDWFEGEDTRCLFVLIEHVGQQEGPGWKLERILPMARELLKGVGNWDDDRSHMWVTNGRWGPGPLVRLFTCCDFDPQMIHRCAVALRNEVLHVTH